MSVSVHEAFCLDSAQDRFWFIDHFLGDQLQDEWRGTGTGTVAVVDQQTGGIVRITTGGATGNDHRIDWTTIRSLLVSKRVSMEVRLKASVSTYINIGIELRFDGNNLIRFYVNELAGGSDNWDIITSDGGASTTADSGIALDASYHIYRIEAFPTGQVHFYIDGTECGNSPITTNIPDDATDYFEPWLYIRTRENATKSMDIDYVAIRQDR